MRGEYVALKCMECGLINVYRYGDGRRCKCGGFVTPIGHAHLGADITRHNNVAIGIKVDTTELDIALDKARELKSIMSVNKGCR